MSAASSFPAIRRKKDSKSDFRTPRRKELSYWLASGIILTVYLAFIGDLILSFPLDEPLRFILTIFLVVNGVVPAFLFALLPRYWHSHLSPYGPALVLCLLSSLPLIVLPSPSVLYSLLFTLILGLGIGFWLILLYVSGRRRWTYLLIIVVALAVLLFSGLSAIIIFVNVLIVTWIVIVGCGLLAIISLRRIFFPEEQRLKLIIAVFGSLIVWLLSTQIITQTITIIPGHVLFLILLIVLLDPSHLLSQLRAGLRHALSFYRTYRIPSATSAFVDNYHPSQRAVLWIRTYFTAYNRTIMLSLILLDGAVLIPLLSGAFHVINNSTLPDLSNLALTGIVTTVSLGVIYLMIWLVHSRSRYIVSRFEVMASQNHDDTPYIEPELRAIGDLITHLLANELQRISVLLKLRQVENVNLSDEVRNAFFVTSGSDQQFIDELQQVVNIEVPSSGGFHLGRLFYFLWRLIARVQISGRVQRRENGSVEIYIQLNRGNNLSANVEQIVLTENSISEIDEYLMRPIAREIALKLLMELGLMAHLGTTLESVNAFVRGLEASANQIWWLAISYYWQVWEIESSYGGQTGVAHYHLGVAFLFQGQWEDGLFHLQQADRHGPQMPETQYMLALAEMSVFWSNLRDENDVFENISQRIHRAIRMRHNFPEAYQLLANLHYRRARQLERDKTRGYISPRDATQKAEEEGNKKTGLAYYGERANRELSGKGDYFNYFINAAKNARHAIRLYNRAMNRTINQPILYTPAQAQTSALASSYALAAHQLADALRPLEHFEEATTYYQDMRLVHARNIRNLADLSKTYCLAEAWGQANSFIQGTVFSDDEAYWNADMAIHAAWAIAGGVKEMGIPTRQRDTPEQYKKYDDVVNKLLECLNFLDYALHQRPRYVTYYAQTNWFDAWHQAISAYLYPTLDAASPELFTHPLNADGKTSIELKYSKIIQTKNDAASPIPDKLLIIKHTVWYIKTWIALRLDGLGFFYQFDKMMEEMRTKSNLSIPKEDRRNQITHLKEMVSLFFKTTRCNPEFMTEGYYEDYKTLRHKIVEFTEDLNRSKRNKGLFLTFLRLEKATELLKLWQASASKRHDFIAFCKNTLPNDTNIPLNSLRASFENRWALDVWLELAQLTARMLVEAHTYELAFEVAQQAQQLANAWRTAWEETYTNDDKARFTVRVFRMQRANLIGLSAYARFQIAYDRCTTTRCKVTGWFAEEIQEPDSAKIKSSDLEGNIILDAIEADLKLIRADISDHLLYLYLDGLVKLKRGLYPQSIRSFERLLDHMTPYDPKVNIKSGQFGDAAPDNSTSTSSLRRFMEFQEHLTGRQQFYSLVDQATVHARIADVYKLMNGTDLRVKHLTSAVRWSPHADEDVDNFMRLANQLIYMERYREALAVLEAIKSPNNQLGHLQLLNSKRVTPEVLHCIALSRSGRYSESMNKAKRVASQMELKYRVPKRMQATDFFDNVDTITSFDPKSSMQRFLRILGRVNRFQRCFIQGQGQVQNDASAGGQTRGQNEDRYQEALLTAAKALKITTIPYDENKLTLSDLINLFMNEKDVKASHQEDNPAADQDNILRIFTRLQTSQNDPHNPLGSFDVKALDNASRQAMFVLSAKSLTELLESYLDILKKRPSTKLSKDYPVIPDKPTQIQMIFWSQVAVVISREISNQLSQLAELCNSLAYNRAETGLRVSHAYKDSAFALLLTYFLMHASPPASGVRDQFSDKLAQYCDTFAWVRYRQLMLPSTSPTASPETVTYTSPRRRRSHLGRMTTTGFKIPTELRIAESYLKKGIRYDADRPILHYHLARVYLSRVELIWQHDPLIADNERIGRYAAEIDRCLTQALRQWRAAKDLDTFDRLHNPIAWLYNQINKYKKAWEARKYTAIAGS